VGLVMVGLVSAGVYTGVSRASHLADEVKARTKALEAANDMLTADISRREEAETALEASERRYRTLFDASPVGLWEEDFSEVRRQVADLAATREEGLRVYLDAHPEEVERLLGLVRVISVNQATLRLHGLSSEQEALEGFAPFVALESMDDVRDELLAVAEGRPSFTAGLTALTRTGARMFLAITVTVVPGFEDSWERVIVAAVDLTERKRAEDELAGYRDQLEALVEERTAELAAANEELRAATRAKDDFFAAMSHELRTPLNSILGFTGVVLSGMAGDVNEEQRVQLSMVRRSGRHLLNLVNDLLDLTRLEATGMPPEAVDFELSEVFDVVARMVEPLADDKGIALAVAALRPDVPMHTDRGQLEQILLNLMGNAVKFASHGVVGLSAAIGDGTVAISVSDEGPGIAEADREAVFDEFRQLTRPDVGKAQGTGLGLAISRRLARGLGGEIELSSEVGRGSTFTVTIPTVLAECDGGADDPDGPQVP
jgi:signal transduction histidine kinase